MVALFSTHIFLLPLVFSRFRRCGCTVFHACISLLISLKCCVSVVALFSPLILLHNLLSIYFVSVVSLFSTHKKKIIYLILPHSYLYFQYLIFISEYSCFPYDRSLFRPYPVWFLCKSFVPIWIFIHPNHSPLVHSGSCFLVVHSSLSRSTHSYWGQFFLLSIYFGINILIFRVNSLGSHSWDTAYASWY